LIPRHELNTRPVNWATPPPCDQLPHSRTTGTLLKPRHPPVSN